MSTQGYPTHYVLRDIPRRHKLQERICAWEKCSKTFHGHAGRNYCCSQCKSRANNTAFAERRSKVENPDKRGYRAPVDQFTDEKAEQVWAAKHKDAEFEYHTAGMSPRQRQEWQAKQAARVRELREGMGL